MWRCDKRCEAKDGFGRLYKHISSIQCLDSTLIEIYFKTRKLTKRFPLLMRPNETFYKKNGWTCFMELFWGWNMGFLASK
jgi:hypothetical protein